MTIPTRRLTLAALPLLGLPAAAQPRPDGPRPDLPAEIITDPRIDRFDLTGSAPPRDTWRIQIARPQAPPPPGGYPVIYLLDGNTTFPEAWKSAPVALPAPAVIVGIGHPTDRRFDLERRWYELTSPLPPGTAPDGTEQRRSGGRAVLLAFIAHDLRPEIERRLPIDRDRQTLFGHSLGGLFALTTLFERPEMFATYVAADPSLWWGNGAIVQQQASFLAGIRAAGGRLARPIGLLVESSGLRRPGPGLTTRPHAGPGARDTVRALSGIEGLTAFHRLLENEGHGSMLPHSVAATLGFAFGTPPSGAEPA